ncbi:MAG: hypothetical protein JSS02_24245, partial [Planctomycetes bacterium]|nr:hypothetical protein [Planctomycetota bacterium]
MDVLPRPLAQLSDQIRHLGPAARIQLVVIPLLVLVGLGVMLHLGGKSAEEALMSGRTLNTEELKAAEKAFQRLALDQYRIVDRKILVPKTEAARYQSALMSSDVGVADTFGKEFAKALETNPLFAGTGSQQVDRMDLARAQVLTNMIKAISYVEDAQVVWSRAKGRSFNTTQRMTALLTVKPRSGQELTAERAKTLQQAVAGCFGMQAEDVTVLDGRSGISVRVDIAESSRQSEHLSAVREYAAHYQQMISEALKDIPNVIIAVNPEIASPALSERTSPQSQPKLQSLQATISIPKDYYREVLSRKQSRPLEKHELRSRLRQIQVDTERDVEQRIARLLPGTSHDLKQNPIKVSSYERLDANEQPSAIDSKPFEQLSRWTRSWGGYAVLSVIACTALWTLFRNPEAPRANVAQPSEANSLMIPADNALETLTDSEELPLRSH